MHRDYVSDILLRIKTVITYLLNLEMYILFNEQHFYYIFNVLIILCQHRDT